MENVIERDVNAAEGMLRKQLETIDKLVSSTAPVGKRALTRKEKLMRSLTQPANTWTPAQKVFVMREMMRMQNGGRP